MLKDCYKDQVIEFKWLDKGVLKKDSMKLSDMKYYSCYYAIPNATGEFIVVDGEPFIEWSDMDNNFELNQKNLNSLNYVELVPKFNKEVNEILNDINSLVFIQSSEDSFIRENIEKLKESLAILKKEALKDIK